MITFLPHPIKLTLLAEGLPPRCRKPRKYKFSREFIFQIPQIEALPEPSLIAHHNILTIKSVKYYEIGGKLYIVSETTAEEYLKSLSREERFGYTLSVPELTDDITVLSDDAREKICKIIQDLQEVCIVKNSNTLLTEEPEPAYETNRGHSCEYISIEERPRWGKTNLYRADQWEEAKAECPKEESTTPLIEILKPITLKGKKNPGDITFSPNGEPPQQIQGKLKTLLNFHEHFATDSTEIYIWIPLAHTDGLWKPHLIKLNDKESRIVLLETDKTGKLPHDSRIQTLLELKSESQYREHWRQKVYHINRLFEDCFPGEEITIEKTEANKATQEINHLFHKVIEDTEARHKTPKAQGTQINAQEEFE